MWKRTTPARCAPCIGSSHRSSARTRRRGLRFTHGGFCGIRRSLLRHGSSPLVGADCTLLTVDSAESAVRCSVAPLSARRRGLRFTCGAFCGKRRSLLRRASSPQKVTLASAAPFASLPTFCGNTRVHGLRGRDVAALPTFCRVPVYTLWAMECPKHLNFVGADSIRQPSLAHTVFGEGTQKRLLVILSFSEGSRVQA